MKKILLTVCVCLLCCESYVAAESLTETDWQTWFDLSQEDVIQRKGEPDGKVLLYKEQSDGLWILTEFRFIQDKLVAVKLMPTGNEHPPYQDTYRQLAGKFTATYGTPTNTVNQNGVEKIIWVLEDMQVTLALEERWIIIFQKR